MSKQTKKTQQSQFFIFTLFFLLAIMGFLNKPLPVKLHHLKEEIKQKQRKRDMSVSHQADLFT